MADAPEKIPSLPADYAPPKVWRWEKPSGGAFASSEVIRLRPVAKSDGQLFFNGESQFFTNDYPGAGGAVNFGTCKYVYQRVAATKLRVPDCKVSPFGAE